ncbi:hypothetical protein BGX27_002854, partial [Mortierella sp. AM989]
MHLAPSIDVVDFPRVGVIDAPPVDVVDSPPDGDDVYEQLPAYFAKNCYADTWALASRTEVSLKWTDLKDFYSNNPQELKKYTVVSGIVRMCCSYSCDELFFDVREGIIQSYLIGYSIVNGADHRDIGMDANLGVGENFIKSWADFLHTHFYHSRTMGIFL